MTLIVKKRQIKFFKDPKGSEPVKVWLEQMLKKNKSVEHSKIETRIKRAGLGNFGDHRFLAGDFGELRIDFGPGYRVYFGLDGGDLILLLHGGSKEDQQNDIKTAKMRWEQHLESKRDDR